MFSSVCVTYWRTLWGGFVSVCEMAEHQSIIIIIISNELN